MHKSHWIVYLNGGILWQMIYISLTPFKKEEKLFSILINQSYILSSHAKGYLAKGCTGLERCLSVHHGDHSNLPLHIHLSLTLYSVCYFPSPFSVAPPLLTRSWVSQVFTSMVCPNWQTSGLNWLIADPMQLSHRDLGQVISWFSSHYSSIHNKGSTWSFPALTFYVKNIQIMNTYLANNMQNLSHFCQQTYTWIMHFVNTHRDAILQRTVYIYKMINMEFLFLKTSILSNKVQSATWNA